MIEVSGLRKSYRTRRRRKVTSVDAVRGVDFAVQRGEIFGFLGPNGAGKTTTLRMLATLIPMCDGLVLTASQNPRALPPPTLQSLAGQCRELGNWQEHFRLAVRVHVGDRELVARVGRRRDVGQVGR